MFKHPFYRSVTKSRMCTVKNPNFFMCSVCSSVDHLFSFWKALTFTKIIMSR